jgi:hypothetical protein
MRLRPPVRGNVVAAAVEDAEHEPEAAEAMREFLQAELSLKHHERMEQSPHGR